MNLFSYLCSLEDLRFYPNSSIAEMATRLPDVEYAELEKTVRAVARNAEIKPIGGRNPNY